MSLLQMSFLGTVIILLIVVLRAVLINRLPKKTFLILWWIALIRLLVPFSIKSVTSIYSLLQSIYSDINPVRTAQTTTFLPIHGNMPEIANGLSEAMVQRTESISILSVIWLAGLLLCFGFFAVSYIKCYREFRFSLPVENDILEAWKEKHPLKRSLSIRQTETIAAPLSYGVIRPVILMPKNTEWKNIYQLRYVLEHEYVHIRRLDMLTKLIMIAAVCIHWFNPLVWVMYILFNRDLELSCDETVVRRFGMDIKSVYATALISMEEKKSGLTPLCNSFSKNAIEERIRAIMKIKKTSKFAVMISAVLVIGVTGGFATSASSLEKKTETAQENGETTVALNEVNIREDESLSSSDVEWWTAEEYAKWLDEEKEVLQSMIGEKAYTGGDGWFVWTQEKVDETIALYEDNLQKIKDGMKLSKSSDDAVGITMAYSPENIEYAKQEAETVTENKDSNENVFSEEQLSEYAKAGITYQKETGFLMYDGKTIGYFRDEFKPGTYTISSKRGGTLRVEVQRENYGTITDVKAEPLSDDFWSEPAVLVESSGGEAVTADEMKGSVFEEGGSENIAADDMGEYSSEEGKGLNIAVPQEYADYGVSCDAQGNWVYNGKIIADLYDEGRGIFSNSNGTMYIEVTRDKSGKISSFQKVSKNRMQELFTEFNPEAETFDGYTSTYYVAPMTDNGTIITSKSYKGPWTKKTLPEITAPVSNVAYDPVNRCLYVYGGGLYIYNPDTWELIHQVQLNHANRPNPLLPNSFQYTLTQGSFCYNGMWCLSSSVFLNEEYPQAETRIATFDLETGNIKQWWIIPIPYSGYEQECVIVDYYGIRTVACGNDKSLCGRYMPFGYGDIQKGISHEDFTVYVDESKSAMGDGLSQSSPMNSLFNAIRTYGNRSGVTYYLLNNVTKGFTIDNMTQACLIYGGNDNSHGFAAKCTFSKCYNIRLQNLTNTANLDFQSCTVTGKNIIVNNVTAGNYSAAFNCTAASTVHFESLTANGCDTVLRSGSGSIVISPVNGSSNTVGLECQYGGFGMTWGSGAITKGKRDTNSSCLVEGALIAAS